MSDLNSEVSSTISAGINLMNDSKFKVKLPKYKIMITGHKEKIQLAKEEMIKLFVLDLEVDVPEEFYPPLIGTKGSKINEIRDKHQVNVLIPTKNTTFTKVIVSGPSERAVAAKKEIMDFVAELEKLKEERLERNSRATVDVPLKYHTQLIGIKGENISKIRNKYTVRIIVPSQENKSTEIVILGHRDNVEKAKAALELFVHKLQTNIIEHLHIEARLHSRLIGSRGANLDQMKKKFSVEIMFPTRGTEGEEANIVKVKGTKEGVDKCSDELIDRANEMLDGMNEQQTQQQQTTKYQPYFMPASSTPTTTTGDNSNNHFNHTPVGFQLRDAPWHQMSASSTTQENWENVTDTESVAVTNPRPANWSKLLSKLSNGVHQ